MGDGRKKEGKFTVKKTFKVYSLVIVFLALLAFVLYLVLFSNGHNVKPAPHCGDGTPNNTCSLVKPYYCFNGFLADNASVCGCPSDLIKQGNLCTSIYQKESKAGVFNYTLDGKKHSLKLELYGGMSNYLSGLSGYITYSAGEQAQRSDFTLKRINNQEEYPLLESLVKTIQNLAPNSTLDQARIAISLVQNIPWGPSDKKLNFYGTIVDYSRYPYQVLYDNKGLCGEKSELLAFILRDIGYSVALFYYPNENHETVGIKCPLRYSLNGTGYCFVETSGPAIISDSNLVYSNGVTLSSNPQLIILSKGMALSDNLPEYKDAKTFTSLQNRVWLDPVSSLILKNLERKYGLRGSYNLT